MPYPRRGQRRRLGPGDCRNWWDASFSGGCESALGNKRLSTCAGDALTLFTRLAAWRALAGGSPLWPPWPGQPGPQSGPENADRASSFAFCAAWVVIRAGVCARQAVAGAAVRAKGVAACHARRPSTAASSSSRGASSSYRRRDGSREAADMPPNLRVSPRQQCQRHGFHVAVPDRFEMRPVQRP